MNSRGQRVPHGYAAMQQGSFNGELQTADTPNDVFRAIASCQSWLREVQQTTIPPGAAEVSVQLVVPVVARFRGGPVGSLTTNLHLVVTADGISAPDQNEPIDQIVRWLEHLANAGDDGVVVSLVAGKPRREGQW